MSRVVASWLRFEAARSTRAAAGGQLKAGARVLAAAVISHLSSAMEDETKCRPRKEGSARPEEGTIISLSHSSLSYINIYSLRPVLLAMLNIADLANIYVRCRGDTQVSGPLSWSFVAYRASKIKRRNNSLDSSGPSPQGAAVSY